MSCQSAVCLSIFSFIFYDIFCRLNEIETNHSKTESSRRPSGSYENVTYDKTGAAHFMANSNKSNATPQKPQQCSTRTKVAEAERGTKSQERIDSFTAHEVVKSHGGCADEFTLDKKLAHLEEMRRLTAKITSMTQSPKRYFPDLYCQENTTPNTKHTPSALQGCNGAAYPSYFPDFQSADNPNTAINNNSHKNGVNHTSLAPGEGNFVSPTDVYKHTDRQATPPKIIETHQAPSNQQRQYSPALHIYQQRNNFLNQFSSPPFLKAPADSTDKPSTTYALAEDCFYSNYSRNHNSKASAVTKEYKMINTNGSPCKPLLKVSLCIVT